jgi:hypothetical protein
MERNTQATGMTESGSSDARGAMRRPNDVWVLSAARIKEVLRGTFLENPAVPDVRSTT